MAVLPLAVTVVKLRLGPEVGARVVSRLCVILRNGLGIYSVRQNMHNSGSSSSSVSLHSLCCFIVLRRSCPHPLHSLLRPRAVAEVSRDGFGVFR